MIKQKLPFNSGDFTRELLAPRAAAGDRLA
jgi:hypothetical protein